MGAGAVIDASGVCWRVVCVGRWVGYRVWHVFRAAVLCVL